MYFYLNELSLMSCVSCINYKRTSMEVIPQCLFINVLLILDELYIDIKKVLTMYKTFCLKQKTKKQNILLLDQLRSISSER